jgi:N-acetylmuramoyl-L-alanine amidase
LFKIDKRYIPGLTTTKLKGNNFIIAHESGNQNNVGLDSLEKEVSFMLTNFEKAFTSHWVGSGGKIIQLAPTGIEQWGAGSPANHYAYAQVELARTNKLTIFKEDYKSYIWLIRKLAREAGIPKTLNTGSTIKDKGVKTHSWVTTNLGGTTHLDPDAYLKSWGISINQFRKDIEQGVKKVENCVPTSYTVVKGDTLWSIAKQYNASIRSLQIDNKLKMDLIYPGDNLIIRTKNSKQTKKLFLPKSVYSWRIYSMNGPYNSGAEIGFLAPMKFGGLEYAILGTLAPNVYKIKTKDYGEVAIYAGSDTSARIR